MFTVIGINADAKIEFQHHSSTVFSTRKEAVDYVEKNRNQQYFWHILETVDVFGPCSVWPREFYRDVHGRIRQTN